MPFFINPFQKHDVSEFPGVLVPLEKANRRPSVISKSESDTEKEHSRDDGLFTVEMLRREVEGDLSAGGLDSAYDRM